MTLRQKSLIFFLILTPVLLLASLSYWQTRIRLIEHVYEEQRNTASLSAEMLKRRLDHLIGIGDFISKQATAQPLTNKTNINHALSILQQANYDLPYIESAFIADTNGYTIATTAKDLEYSKADRSDLDWYIGVRKNWEPYLTQIFRSPINPEQIFSALAIPAKNQEGEVQAILVLQLNMENLLKWGSILKDNKNNSINIVNGRNPAVTGSTDHELDPLLAPLDTLDPQTARSGQPSVGLVYDPVIKKNRLAGYQQIKGYGWAVLVRQGAVAAEKFKHSLRALDIFFTITILIEILIAMLVTKEIIRRKKSDETLEQYTDLLENSHVVIREIQNDKITIWNEGMEKLYGWGKNEMFGKSLHQLLHTEFPVPQEQIEYVLLKKNEWYGELTQKNKLGKTLYLSSHWYLHRDPHGNPAAILETVTDITSLKEAQRQMEFLNRQINQSNDAIYTVDKNIIIQTWNQGAEKMYGYTKEEAIGKDPNLLLRTDTTSEYMNKLNHFLWEKNYWSGEYNRITKSGNHICVSSYITTLRDDQGNRMGAITVNHDISKQKKEREELDYLASIVEQSREAILSRGTDHRIISWNQGAEKMFGYSKAEAIGKTVSELGILKLSNEEINSFQQETLEKKVAVKEFKYYCKDGNSFIGEGSMSSIKNENGKALSYTVMIRNISERKQLEDQLRKMNEVLEEKVKARTAEVYKNEKRFRALVENSSDIIILINQSFEIIYRSASKRFAGRQDEEMIGAPITHFIHPDFHQRAQVNLQDLLAHPGKIINIFSRYRHKEGHYIWVEGIAMNLLHDENVKAIVINSRDVTQRIEAEEKMRLTLKELSDYKFALDESSIVSITNHKGLITYANDNFCQISKFSRKELIGHHHSIINSKYHPKSFFTKFWDTITKGNIWRGEIMNKAKDGSHYWVQTTIVPFLGEDKKPYQYMAIRNDITERKLAEEKIKESNERFELVTSATNDIIWDWQIGSNQFWWNKNYDPHIGQHNESNSPDVLILQKGIHPEDKARVLSGIYQALKRKQEFWSDEYRFIKADGSFAYMMGRGYILFDDHDKPYRMVGAMANISNRKQAEAELQQSFTEKQSLADRLSTILNSLPASIALLDKNGKIMEVNQNWKTFSEENEYNVAPYFITQNQQQIANETQYEEKTESRLIVKGIQALLARQTNQFVHEYPWELNGNKRWYRMIATPINGKISSGAVLIIMDISELRKLEEERMQQKNEEQKITAKAMILGQEKERAAISRELHDNVNQILAGTNLYLSVALKQPNKRLDHIQSAIDNIRRVIEENRRLSHVLASPDFGFITLEQQLLNLTDKMLKIIGIEVSMSTTHLKENKLSAEQKLAIYRIAQEQSSNIIKHADAKKVSMFISTENEVMKMIISDDGKGRDATEQSEGIGLKNIRSRLNIFNGSLQIFSSPNNGFVLAVSMPIIHKIEN
ncbi:MAG: PAS domain S-box protein [Bacteroidetes bacterium]|nr:PAS domain S-box protein [Bacteroidota bacterium]